MLIYPLISYKQEFFLTDHYDEEVKAFKAEIETKKKAEEKLAADEGRKPDFDQARDCYDEKAKEYFFNLAVEPVKPGVIEAAPK